MPTDLQLRLRFFLFNKNLDWAVNATLILN